MIDMAQTGIKRSANYSNCPLKKRPIKYDLADESDSDISRNESPPMTIDVSEPENLSTKPEDLRLTSKCIVSSTELTPSPPPISLIAGRRDLPSPKSYSGNNYPHQLYGPTPPYSPDLYLPLHEPPMLKFLPPGGPLEPISLNPPAAWPRISPYSAFSFPPSQRSQVSPNPYPYSRHQNNQNDHHRITHYPINYPKASPSSVQPFMSQPHYSPYTNSRGDSNSPPHISPPLKTEPSYPIIKQEVHRIMSMAGSPLQQMNTRIVDKSSATKFPMIKREVNHGNYHSLTRESIISHTQGHSCSSGVSSPTSSTSSCSDRSLPPMPTPTNGGSVRYQCPDCSKSYSTYSGLTKHVQFHCSSQNKKSFICKYCEKVYVSLGALKMHIRTHTLPCKCMECGKAFSRPWLLQGHIRTHTGEKPFSCQHCNRAFADRSNLRAHLQTHSEVKKYSCKVCSKTFSRMSLLVKHEDSGCSSTLSN